MKVRQTVELDLELLAADIGVFTPHDEVEKFILDVDLVIADYEFTRRLCRKLVASLAASAGPDEPFAIEEIWPQENLNVLTIGKRGKS